MGLRLWVSYAGGGKEAHQRPYVFLDLAKLDREIDGNNGRWKATKLDFCPFHVTG
jgi:hypothetical protein